MPRSRRAPSPRETPNEQPPTSPSSASATRRTRPSSVLRSGRGRALSGRGARSLSRRSWRRSLAAGQEREAEKRAAEVLARWPESEAARRVVRAAEERRRLAQEVAEQRAREIEAALQAKRDEGARPARVQALLAAPEIRERVSSPGWILDPALRPRVGEPVTLSGLLPRKLRQRRSSAAGSTWTSARAALARPEWRLVLAVAAARQRLPSDPEGAIDLLAPYETMLERVPEARRIAREANAEILARRAARAREELLWARRELAGGDATSALARLDAPVMRDLGDEEHAEAEALREEAARLVLHDKRVAEVGRLRRSGALFEARALADELLAEASPEDRPRWAQERQGIQEEIQRAFRVEIDREPSPLFEAGGRRRDADHDGGAGLADRGRTHPGARRGRSTTGSGSSSWTWAAGRCAWRWCCAPPSGWRASAFRCCGARSGSSACSAACSRSTWSTSQRWSGSGRRGEILPAGQHTGGVAITADRGAAGPRY